VLRLRETLSMSISRVVPNIKSERFDENRSFYVDLLGFELVMDMGWIMTFASPTNPTAQVSILSRDATASAQPDMSIEVQDVDAVHAAALRRGSEIVYPLTDEAWGVRRFFIRDPNGIVINVLSHGKAGD
jgi:catechol 2,3-dioxygenase-like lactoylglutathione lyase family enzyme